ncbi:mttA/Hcf106 family [Rubrobacter radiotolerans]|uniref:MttA/Hcf106 family n=1 Tax=Rubrobacter radiotolerans TaxID=42256 RepID=A0A023X3Y7_RUBRA|nr:twin-arginine translocase TatA/TatE family subunit [Rubrobacter radiotolerans]AHY47048.1 mttA/Hcf106 family [Rubrobacter radiotolerans]MDX5894454.1 twin-arginine translocase TatA/TatE family subunit [Rubrobacter radiotolerans]SMC06038.1 sec-independent protein translocase protein TatB [Rubrobacter radiotolerans DSM 5868]
MFGGLGGSEIVIIGLLFLVIFGPSKLPQMARDIGRFVGQARRAVDEFKEELSAEADLADEKSVRNRPARSRRKAAVGGSGKSAPADRDEAPNEREDAGLSGRRNDGLNDL